MCSRCGGFGCPQCSPSVPELSAEEFVVACPQEAADILGALMGEVEALMGEVEALNMSRDALIEAALTYRRQRDEARGLRACDSLDVEIESLIERVKEGLDTVLGLDLPGFAFANAERADDEEREDDEYEDAFDAHREEWSRRWNTDDPDNEWCIVYHTLNPVMDRDEPENSYIGGRTAHDTYRAPFSSYDSAQTALANIREDYGDEIAERYRIAPYVNGRALGAITGTYYEEI